MQQMQKITLRSLQNDPRPHVAEQARAVTAGMERSGPVADFLDLCMDDLVEAMVGRRRSLPDKSSDLSIVDSALIPLLELHRALFVAQPIEDHSCVSKNHIYVCGELCLISRILPS